MIDRCHRPVTDKDRKNYADRGISVCPEWRGSFQAFLDHVGRAPTPRHSIDRIDNDRGYEPGNVRWATPKQQSYNSRRVRLLTLNGTTLDLVDWERKTGINRITISARLDCLGWSVEKALTKPQRHKGGGRVPLTMDGETMSANSWAKRTGIKLRTILYRVHAGWPTQRVLGEPTNNRGQER
jgi:hypothetical protein